MSGDTPKQHASAPPPDFTEEAQPVQNAPPPHSQYPNQPPPSYDQPPAYNEAIAYPQVPPQNMPAPYTPQTQIPVHAHYPNQNYSPNPSSPVILGAPPPPPGGYPRTTTTQVIVTPVQGCVWCHQGVVQNETDACCLICLIVIAILTFPFGLILLCCIPCTVHPRCTNCHRLQT
uniref:Membrane protein BRI3 n=1 Tax=Panagrellus redivivus TaxID=6233 RepID=A0A7E4VAL8_PANRE